MSVSNGQPASAATFNNAFLSKQDGGETQGVLDLNESSSGPQIPNAQLAINQGLVNVQATETLAGGGQIDLDTDYKNFVIPVESSGGAVTMNALPFGSESWQDGSVVRLIGTSSSDTVQIDNNDVADGIILNGSIILEQYMVLTLVYISSLGRWIEIGRNA